MQGCGYGAGVSVYGRVKVIFFRKRVKDLPKFWQIYIFLYICRPNIPNTMFRTHPRGPMKGRARDLKLRERERLEAESERPEVERVRDI